jgi:hypothetical protein
VAKTDKTRPVWVQMLDPTNRGWLEEHHDHTKGVCDIDKHDPSRPWRWRSSCCFWPSGKAAHEGIYPRPGKAIEWYTGERIGRERTAWRALRQRILGGDLEAADESPLGGTHRHAALWDAF